MEKIQGETILAELIRYTRYCLEDRYVTEYEDYISCKKHKQACMRFLSDVRRSKDKDCPFYWDEKEASKIVSWFHLLYHSKGELAGKPIDLTLWEKFFVCQIYGWRMRDTHRRRFKKSFTEVARKNAKSQLEAGIALYEISVIANENGEVSQAFTAGTKREQSKIVFTEAGLMLHGSPLKSKFTVKVNEIVHKKTGSTLKPLSKEDGKNGDGTNPALLVLDEYHQHKTEEFYKLGMGANSKEPLLMIITTAGEDLNYPCYTVEYNYCSKIIDPDVDVEDDEYFVDILELDPEDYKGIESLDNERLWHKANPIRMTYPLGVEKIRGDYKKAREQQEELAGFLTKEMNVWVQMQKDQYMDMAKWAECAVDERPIDLNGAPAYWGFDLSAKHDLTSVTLVIPYQSKTETDDMGKPVVKYWIFTHSFIPNETILRNHIATDRVPYDLWARQGWLTITNTDIVDQSTVMKYVIDFSEEHNLSLQAFCFDPANASKLEMDLDGLYGGSVRVEEVYQSAKSQNESTKGLRDAVLAGNVTHDRNPLMSYAMSNAIVKTNQDGLIKIDKSATTKRIDPVDATLDAFKLAMYHSFDAINFGDYIMDFIDKFNKEA